VTVELLVSDFDGTLATHRGGWSLLWTLFGTADRGEDHTAAFDRGEITYAEWCERVVEDWQARCVTNADVCRVRDAVKPTHGVDALFTTAAEHDVPVGVLSSGLAALIDRFEAFEHRPAFTIANELCFDATGKLVGVTAQVGPNDKGDLLRACCAERDIDIANVAYVGDSYSDTEAFAAAGTAILFDPAPETERATFDHADQVIEERDLGLVAEAVFDR
jgi:phosphoserine phosphatase